MFKLAAAAAVRTVAFVQSFQIRRLPMGITQPEKRRAVLIKKIPMSGVHSNKAVAIHLRNTVIGAAGQAAAGTQ